MADSNNHNGNGRNWYHELGWETLGLGLAEFASMTISVGAFTFLGEIAPNTVNSVSKVVSKACIEPFLDTIEGVMQKTCKLKECQPDFTKSRQERAEQYAKYVTLFAASIPLGVGTEMLARIWLNNKFKVKAPPSDGLRKWLQERTPTFMHSQLPTWHDVKVVGIDRGIHLGAILGVNTLLSKQADTAIDGITHCLQKSLNWPADRAKRAAEMLVVYEGPNWLGFSAATAYLAGYHHNLRNK